MKFVCDRCQTKYSIADDRVRGKILKVKCKTCANVITVREERRPSAPHPTLSRAGSAAFPTITPEHESERTVIAASPALLADAIPSPPAARRSSASMPAVGAGEDGLAWYMALSGERSGPFSRRQLVDKLVGLPRNADLHVWNEQLGSWKPPSEVPAIAADLAARRRAPPPVPPGAPRRPAPPPLASLGLSPAASGVMAPPVAAGHRPIPSPLGAQAHAPSLGPGPAVKLPPPTGGTRPRATLSSLAAATAPARAPDSGVDIDPSSMLETPAPQPHMFHGTNGFGSASAHAPASATRSSSDVVKLLNIPGAPQPTTSAGHSPRVMSADDMVGWGGADVSKSRALNTKAIIGLLAVVGVIVVVLVVSLGKKAPPPPVKVAVADPMAGMLEKMEKEPPPAPKPTVAPPVEAPPVAPAPTGARGKGKLVGAKGKGRPGPASGPTTPADPTAARYADTSGTGVKVAPLAAAVRPPPSQAQLTAVVKNNQNAIKTCYQRALARDNSLTHGKIIVKLTLGISGRVKGSRVDGPAQFRTIEPCIREVVGRWVFPQASEEYDFEFPLVFQGNE